MPRKYGKDCAHEFLTSVLGGDASDLVEQAKEFVKDNYSVDEIYDDNEIMEYAKKNFPLEDLATPQDLDDWARENGYVKE